MTASRSGPTSTEKVEKRLKLIKIIRGDIPLTLLLLVKMKYGII